MVYRALWLMLMLILLILSFDSFDSFDPKEENNFSWSSHFISFNTIIHNSVIRLRQRCNINIRLCTKTVAKYP